MNMNIISKCARFTSLSYNLFRRKCERTPRGRFTWHAVHGIAGVITGYSIMTLIIAKLGTLAALALWSAGMVCMLGYFYNRAKRAQSAATLAAIMASLRRASGAHCRT